MSDTLKRKHGIHPDPENGGGQGKREKLAVLEERMTGYLKELGYE